MTIYALEGKLPSNAPKWGLTSMLAKMALAKNKPLPQNGKPITLTNTGSQDTPWHADYMHSRNLSVVSQAFKETVASVSNNGLSFCPVSNEGHDIPGDLFLMQCLTTVEAFDQDASEFETFRSGDGIKLITRLEFKASTLEELAANDIHMFRTTKTGCSDLDNRMFVSQALGDALRATELTGFKLYTLDEWQSNIEFIDSELDQA